MPIGNLTSQIFANIYLNEFDRFVKHTLKPKAYLRYGDDFIIVENDFPKLHNARAQATDFLKNSLKLQLNPKRDKIFKASHGLKFLGVTLWPKGRQLSKRNIGRIFSRLNLKNAASYRGLLFQHGSRKNVKLFHWLLHEQIPGNSEYIAESRS